MNTAVRHRAMLCWTILALLLLVVVSGEARAGWFPGWASTDLRLTAPEGGSFIVTVNEVKDPIPLTEVGFGQQQLHKWDGRQRWLDHISFMVTMQPPNTVIRDAAMNQDGRALAFGTITRERGNADLVRWPSDLTIAIVTNKRDTLPAVAIDVMVGTTTHTVRYLDVTNNVWLGGQALRLFPDGNTIRISQALTAGSCRYVAQFPKPARGKVKRYVWYRVHGAPDDVVKRTMSAAGTGSDEERRER